MMKVIKDQYLKEDDLIIRKSDSAPLRANANSLEEELAEYLADIDRIL